MHIKRDSCTPQVELHSTISKNTTIAPREARYIGEKNHRQRYRQTTGPKILLNVGTMNWADPK